MKHLTCYDKKNVAVWCDLTFDVWFRMSGCEFRHFRLIPLYWLETKTTPRLSNTVRAFNKIKHVTFTKSCIPADEVRTFYFVDKAIQFWDFDSCINPCSRFRVCGLRKRNCAKLLSSCFICYYCYFA